MIVTENHPEFVVRDGTVAVTANHAGSIVRVGTVP
jgi:hypothetical protein